MPWPAALAKYSLVGDFILLRLAAQVLRGNLLQLRLGIDSSPRNSRRWIVSGQYLPV